MTWSPDKVIVASIAALAALYVGSCTYISESGQRNFKNVRAGNSVDDVLLAMGDPSHVQQRGAKAPGGYGESKCEASCAKRLWYLNRSSLMGEAWSFEINEQGNVVGTAYWMSP